MFNARKDIINLFEKGIFPFKGNVFKTKEEKEEIKEKTKEEKIEEFINNVISFIEKESKDIDNDLFKKYFDFSTPVALTKELLKIKDARRNNEFVQEIKNRYSNLKDEIQEMSKEEIKNEKPNEILRIVNEIINFNRDIQKQQQGKGWKILISDNMISRLPISLAQLKAGSNSEKLKNEIRQILYSFYR